MLVDKRYSTDSCLHVGAYVGGIEGGEVAITALQEQLYLLVHYVFSQFINLGVAITVLYKTKEKDKTPYGEEEGRLRQSISLHIQHEVGLLPTK